MDEPLECTKALLSLFNTKPDSKKEFHQDLIELTETVVNCVEALCLTVRLLFRDIKTVRDNAHKVTFYKESI